jgi:hypothetical protein
MAHTIFCAKGTECLRGCHSDISVSQSKKTIVHPGTYWAKTCRKIKEKLKGWQTKVLDCSKS